MDSILKYESYVLISNYNNYNTIAHYELCSIVGLEYYVFISQLFFINCIFFKK